MTVTPEATTGSLKNRTPKAESETRLLIDCIIDALMEKKAQEIVLLDVRELTTLTDFFIVCHGSSDTQIGALANNVLDRTREKLSERAWKREGLEMRRWIILDYVNVVLHIFNKEKRNYYGIEKMWNDAVRTDISDDQTG